MLNYIELNVKDNKDNKDWWMWRLNRVNRNEKRTKKWEKKMRSDQKVSKQTMVWTFIYDIILKHKSNVKTTHLMEFICQIVCMFLIDNVDKCKPIFCVLFVIVDSLFLFKSSEKNWICNFVCLFMTFLNEKTLQHQNQMDYMCICVCFFYWFVLVILFCDQFWMIVVFLSLWQYEIVQDKNMCTLW